MSTELGRVGKNKITRFYAGDGKGVRYQITAIETEFHAASMSAHYIDVSASELQQILDLVRLREQDLTVAG